MANAFARERTALSSEHTRVPMLSLTLTLIQGAAVVVGLACWLMLLPMLPRLWVKDAGLGLGLEGRSEESYVICVRLGGRHERKLRKDERA